jgi:pimeloyl-ACP methyl ester carboxylesterase
LTAAAHPGLVRALVLVEAAPGEGNPRASHDIGRWLDSWPDRFSSRTEAVDFFGGGPVGEGWAAGLEQREDGCWYPRFDRDVMVASVAEAARVPTLRTWRQVTCPTLVVLARSTFVPARDIDAMFAQRPPAQAVSIPGTGHDLHLQRPGVLRELMASFLRSPT